MPDAEQSKVCPFCAETIKAAAKLCPYCRSKQVRNALLRQELTVGIPVVILVVVLLVLLAKVSPGENGAGGRSFVGHRNELLVQNTALAPDPTQPDFWLIGIVTNQGAYAWRVHELEVRFVDERGNLLDVRHPELKDLFVIQSHQEHGFRVDLGKLAFTNDNVTRQVRIQIATDGNRQWKPD